MSNRTPPLPALRAYAAFVQSGSISSAADALCLTQGAVSHQIRALENFLQVRLVERQGRRLTLTDQGRIYGYQVRQALDVIADASTSIQKVLPHAMREHVVRVAVLPSFMQGWLLPRLHGFCKLYPHTRLVFHSSMAYVELGDGQVDCAIRFGHGGWPDASIRPLMNDSLLLVASPGLLGKRVPASLAQVMRFPLLHASESWALWLSCMSAVDIKIQRPRNRMEFTDSTHLLEAVRMGLGIALTRRSIADQMLRRGEIIQVLDHECLHTSSYSVLLPRSASPNPAVEQWLGWLQHECGRYARQQIPLHLR